MGGSPVKEQKKDKPRAESSRESSASYGTPIGLLFLVLAVLGALAYIFKFKNKKSDKVSDTPKKEDDTPPQSTKTEPQDPVEPHPNDEVAKRFAK